MPLTQHNSPVGGREIDDMHAMDTVSESNHENQKKEKLRGNNGRKVKKDFTIVENYGAKTFRVLQIY